MAGGVDSVPARQPFKPTRTAFGPEIMERGEFVSAPRGKPIGPAEIKESAGLENLVNRREESFRSGEMFEHIGTDDELIPAQPFEGIFIQIDPDEGVNGQFRREMA